MISQRELDSLITWAFVIIFSCGVACGALVHWAASTWDVDVEVVRSKAKKGE
jgi:hypothetical protein